MIVVHCTNGSSTELYHHGVKGQKWGIRRYQNQDGTLTAMGRKHYGISDESSEEEYKAAVKQAEKADRHLTRTVKVAAASAVIGASAGIGKYMKAHDIKMKDIPGKVATNGKKAADQVLAGAKEGLKNGLKNGPSKAVETVIKGGAMVGAYYLTMRAVGAKMTAQMFAANDSKKVSKFMDAQPANLTDSVSKFGGGKKDDDDDDD